LFGVRAKEGGNGPLEGFGRKKPISEAHVEKEISLGKGNSDAKDAVLKRRLRKERGTRESGRDLSAR